MPAVAAAAGVTAATVAAAMPAATVTVAAAVAAAVGGGAEEAVAVMVATVMARVMAAVGPAPIAVAEDHWGIGAVAGLAGCAFALSGGLAEGGEIELTRLGEGEGIGSRSFERMRRVMNQAAGDGVAVGGVFGGVEDVLMPEVIQIGRPGDQCRIGMRG